MVPFGTVAVKGKSRKAAYCVAFARSQIAIVNARLWNYAVGKSIAEIDSKADGSEYSIGCELFEMSI